MKTKDINITKELRMVLKEKETLFDKNEIELFEDAIKEYDNLIKKGLAKKREYSLMTIEEKHLSILKYSTNFR